MGFHKEDDIEPTALEVYVFTELMKARAPELDPKDLTKLEKLIF